ncbi:CsbD family protein [Pleurocapsa sp. FMAR1]|uniref:CsbD family protein n=1 Tax=Pleurocapsa sp. FMAR1 TaxID=3040204 RepID=UPI0029C8CE7D|nr:CsbD family protein [Pleurocapsa sp. FMAR1]
MEAKEQSNKHCVLDKGQKMITKFKIYAGKLTIALSAIAFTIFVGFNSFTASANASVNIEAFNNPSVLAATASGIGDRVEGSMQEGMGTVKRKASSDIDNKAEGALNEAKGNVKQGIGTAKNKLDDAKDTVGDKSESFVDSVKDFFD